MAGILNDGHPTRITFTDFPVVEFCEKEVTPPGVEGGGANDTTCMKNTVWRTMQPKKLKTLAEGGATVAYETVVIDTIVAMVNVNQLITVTFPDGSSVAFWGWLDTFVPGALVEGEQPTAEITIIPSNQDAAGAEAGPVHTP